MIDLLYGIYQRIIAFFCIIYFIIKIIVNLILCVFLPVGWLLWLLNRLCYFLSRNFKKNVAIIFVFTNIFIIFRCLTSKMIAPGIIYRIFSLEMLKWEAFFFVISYIIGFSIGFVSYCLLKPTSRMYTKIFDRKDNIVKSFRCILDEFSNLIYG